MPYVRLVNQEQRWKYLAVPVDHPVEQIIIAEPFLKYLGEVNQAVESFVFQNQYHNPRTYLL